MTNGTLMTSWRYPVKSMLGETVDSTAVTEAGLTADRSYAVVDPATGRVLSAKREPALFTCRATLDAEGRVSVTLPDQRTLPVDDPQLGVALSDLLGREVVVTGEPAAVSRIEKGETSATTGGVASEFTGPARHLFRLGPDPSGDDVFTHCAARDAPWSPDRRAPFQAQLPGRGGGRAGWFRGGGLDRTRGRDR